MPLAPLHSDSIRPPDGAFGVACWSERLETSKAHLCFAVQTCRRLRPDPPSVSGWVQPISSCDRLRTSYVLTLARHRFPPFHRTTFQTTRNAPFRRPSAGGVEGVERHGCRESRDGTWMSLRGGPLEHHRSEGTPAQPGPDAGASVFVSLFANLQTPRTRSPFSNVGWKTAQHFPPLTTAELLPNHADPIRPTNFIRPTKRDVSRFLLVRSHRNKQSALRPPLQNFQTTRSQIPVRRPSVIAVEGVERHGCRESCDGSGPPSVGMALRSVPLERRWSEGTLRAAKGRMQGSPSLWLLSLGETRESNAPCEAQPVGGAKESAAPHRSTQATANTQCTRKRQTNSPYEFHPLPTRAAARPFASPPRQPHCPQRRHP